VKSCSICSKKFIGSIQFEKHISSHQAPQTFTCHYENCNKSFIRNSRLAIHLRTHTGVKPFSCQFCKISFNEKGNLLIHERIHTGQKPFMCSFELCKKSFKAHGQLKDHLKIHYNIKPFKCHLCFKIFSRKSILKTHYKTHPDASIPEELNPTAVDKSFSFKANESNKLLMNIQMLNQESSLSKTFYGINNIPESKAEQALNSLDDNSPNKIYVNNENYLNNQAKESIQPKSSIKDNIKHSNSIIFKNKYISPLMNIQESTIERSPDLVNNETSNSAYIFPTPYSLRNSNFAQSSQAQAYAYSPQLPFYSFNSVLNNKVVYAQPFSLFYLNQMRNGNCTVYRNNFMVNQSSMGIINNSKSFSNYIQKSNCHENGSV